MTIRVTLDPNITSALTLLMTSFGGLTFIVFDFVDNAAETL